jgi:hypothetical protein
MTMPRTQSLPVIAVGLIAAVFVVVGCHSGSESDVDSRGRLKPIDKRGDSTAKKDKLMADWPKPDGCLIISGEQIGFLEPCGCSEGQRGGLARRLDLVQKLRAQGWPVELVDLGDIINNPNTHGGPVETKIRFTYALKALETMKYQALGIGPADLKLGVQEVIAQYLNLGDAPKIVCANVRPDPGLGLDSKFVPSLSFTTGGVKVGLTAIIDPEALRPFENDPDLATMLVRSDPAEVVPAILAEMKKTTDTQILMVQGTPESAHKWAALFPGFEFVVGTSASVDPRRDTEPANDGKTSIFSVGKKGEYVGILGLYKDDGGLSHRYRRIELNARYDKTTEPIRTLVDVEFQDELRRAGVLESYVRRSYVFNDAPTGASYVSAETCKQCHPKTYDRWKQTRHARAWDSLLNGPRGNHEFDADCVRCHSTGFEYTGGFVSAEQTPSLKGNQCENCHGPGSKHAAEPDNDVFRRSVARSAADFKKNNRCITCHSEDDSPKFDFDKYYGGVVHKGLDSYDDPKVHKGVKVAPGAVASQAD